MINEAFESKDEGYDIRFEVVNLTKNSLNLNLNLNWQ